MAPSVIHIFSCRPAPFGIEYVGLGIYREQAGEYDGFFSGRLDGNAAHDIRKCSICCAFLAD